MPSGAWRGWLAQHIKRSSWIAGRSIPHFQQRLCQSAPIPAPLCLVRISLAAVIHCREV